MKVTRLSAVTGVAVVAAMTLAACGSSSGSGSGSGAGSGSSSPGASAQCATGTINGSGSTFQQNIEQQWISGYTAKCSGAQINYQGVGSGAGIQQFGLGTNDFAGSDVVMKPGEQAKANSRCGGTAIHIPVTAGGIAIEYNLSGVSTLKLSAPTLAGIFEGTIKHWNDPKIAADNPGVSLPATAVQPFHRSDGSGTTSVFSSFLKAEAGAAWTLGSGKTLQWPAGAGQGAKGSDGVTAGVKQTSGGIGYSEVSFATGAGLPTAQIKNAGGSYVAVSAATVTQAIDEGLTITGTGNNLAGKLNFTKMTTGYPISTDSYVIVCQKYTDAAKAKLLQDYLNYAVTSGQSGAASLGFAPLPAAIVSRDQRAIASIS